MTSFDNSSVQHRRLGSSPLSLILVLHSALPRAFCDMRDVLCATPRVTAQDPTPTLARASHGERIAKNRKFPTWLQELCVVAVPGLNQPDVHSFASTTSEGLVA